MEQKSKSGNANKSQGCDKMYVDYAGKTLSIIDKDTGEIKEVQSFVAILGASKYTYAEASMSQQKEDFVISIENAIHFSKALPLQLFPII